MKISWSEKAEEDFEQNIIFLLDRWNENVAQSFTSETVLVLKIISKTPKVFQKNKKLNVHFVPITKQVTLFYEIQKKQIILLRFWNNFQNPRKIKFK